MPSASMGRSSLAPKLWCVGLLGLGASLMPTRADAAGLNVERIRIDPDKDGLHGGVRLGVNFQAGNTNRLDLRSSAALAYRRGKHHGFLYGSSQYSTRTRAIEGEGLELLLDRDSRIINKATAHARYNYDLLDWLSAEVFTQVERNEFLLLESRILFGLGPRFEPVRNEEFSLAIGTDYMFEFEALDAARVVEPLPADTIAHRWSSYLSLAYEANERLMMSSTTYVQPRFDLFADLRVLSESALDVTLIAPLSLRLMMRVRWDSQPSTYCSSQVAVAGCPDSQRIRLRELDIAVENSLSVEF